LTSLVKSNIVLKSKVFGDFAMPAGRARAFDTEKALEELRRVVEATLRAWPK
jgi:hypothetical protein